MFLWAATQRVVNTLFLEEERTKRAVVVLSLSEKSKQKNIVDGALNQG